MKRFLFVDDRSKRIHEALEKYSGFELVIAPNVPEALRLLSRYDWDIVSLDFDLNGNDFSDPDSRTCGMEIVRYLERTAWPKSRKLPDFIVHSSNLFAAELMFKRLTWLFPMQNILRQPFSLTGAEG